MTGTDISSAIRAYTPLAAHSGTQAYLDYLSGLGPDLSCGTYIDLRPPTPASPLHGRTTHYLAQVAMGAEPALAVPFDTAIPLAWRYMTAATFGISKLVTPQLQPLAPGTTALEHICSLASRKHDASPALVQLLYRLGAWKSAFRVAGIQQTAPDDLLARIAADEDPSSSVTAYYLRHGAPQELLEAVTARAADGSLTWQQRAALARFVLVRVGKAKAAGNRNLDRAYEIGVDLADHFVAQGAAFGDRLTVSKLHRALAFRPFLERDRDACMRHLTTCERLIADLAPADRGEELLLADHLFPILETTAVTLTHYQDFTGAESYARKLVALDPNDARAWFSLGKVLLSQHKYADAAAAYEAAAGCEAPHRERADHAAGLLRAASDSAQAKHPEGAARC